MQSQVDQEFKFIMVYQDHLTKYVLLQALRRKRADEIAFQLTAIFLTFGVLCILHFDNGKEFINKVINELFRTEQWSKTNRVGQILVVICRRCRDDH